MSLLLLLIFVIFQHIPDTVIFVLLLRYVVLIGVMHGQEKCTAATFFFFFLQQRISGKHYECKSLKNK